MCVCHIAYLHTNLQRLSHETYKKLEENEYASFGLITTQKIQKLDVQYRVHLKLWSDQYLKKKGINIILCIKETVKFCFTGNFAEFVFRGTLRTVECNSELGYAPTTIRLSVINLRSFHVEVTVFVKHPTSKLDQPPSRTRDWIFLKLRTITATSIEYDLRRIL